MGKLSIYTFPSGSLGCNCSVIYCDSSKEAIIIDPGDDEQLIMNLVEKQGLKVKLLLHTHAHFDHISCSKSVKEKTNSKICLHKGDELLYKNLPAQRSMFGFSPSDPGSVDEWIEDGQEYSLSFENGEFKDFLTTIHTPGHTEGSCSFYTEYFEQPILFAGDTLFQSSIGRTDLPGGDFEVIKKSIKERLYRLPDETRVITGHGAETQIYHEKKFNPFVSA
tara:strand:- start:245 stop:907 length:663 start_codon:yes stop_codon:yes gene_type:complete